jgi:hypothetical protein
MNRWSMQPKQFPGAPDRQKSSPKQSPGALDRQTEHAAPSSPLGALDPHNAPSVYPGRLPGVRHTHTHPTHAAKRLPIPESWCTVNLEIQNAAQTLDPKP